MAYEIDLSGRVAVVTGGNGGIGLGMAHALARQGANIVLDKTSSNGTKAVREIRELRDAGYEVEVRRVSDVAREEIAARLRDRIHLIPHYAMRLDEAPRLVETNGRDGEAGAFGQGADRYLVIAVHTCPRGKITSS